MSARRRRPSSSAGGGPGSTPSSEGERRLGSSKRIYVCDLCGAVMLDLHCKLVCERCGYRRDCSDP